MYSSCPQQEIKDVHESEEAKSDLGAPPSHAEQEADDQAAVGPSNPTFAGLLLWMCPQASHIRAAQATLSASKLLPSPRV